MWYIAFNFALVYKVRHNAMCLVHGDIRFTDELKGRQKMLQV